MAAHDSADFVGRTPPRDLEAERAVLGSLLLDADMCDEVALILRADDFYAEENQKLYTHVMALHDEGRKADVVLLVDRLKKAGAFEAVGGAAYLAEVAQSVPTAANAVHYAEIVRDKAVLRALIHTSNEIQREAYDPSGEPRELLGRAEQKIFAIHDNRSSSEVMNMHDVLQEAFDQIYARVEHGSVTGVLTGFTDLDSQTGGLQRSELVILAARPSMGKTALAANIAEHVALDQNSPTLFVSLEMSRLELANRMLCSLARVDSHKLREGFASDQDMQRLIEKSASLSQAPLFIDDTPSRTVTEIAAAARRLQRKQGLGLVIIDYLQLIEPDNPRDPRQEQVAKIARRLKALARELKVPVLCLAQLNRQAEVTKDNRPRLSHLRESGAIEQDADVVLFVHREEYYHTREEAEAQDLVGRAEVIVAKQRNGPIGEVKLTWLKQFTRFEDAASTKQETYVENW